MTIDFLNAQRLISGETYLLTLPEMEIESLQVIHRELGLLTEDTGCKFLVLVGGATVAHHIPRTAN